MEVTLKIPDDIAKEIRNGSDTPLERRVLELAVIQAHLSNLITEREVMEVLGFEDREELYEFFKRYDVAASTLVKTLKQVVPRLRTC
ncbi:MAG TPA: hypothetical protein VN345_16015 [Blastocatellia bacterium]|nr:hypothetical protein [Blastocatellia bacterium]